MRHFRHLCFSSCPPPPRLDLSLLLVEEGLFFCFVLPVFPFRLLLSSLPSFRFKDLMLLLLLLLRLEEEDFLFCDELFWLEKAQRRWCRLCGASPPGIGGLVCFFICGAVFLCICYADSACAIIFLLVPSCVYSNNTETVRFANVQLIARTQFQLIFRIGMGTAVDFDAP